MVSFPENVPGLVESRVENVLVEQYENRQRIVVYQATCVGNVLVSGFDGQF